MKHNENNYLSSIHLITKIFALDITFREVLVTIRVSAHLCILLLF